MSKYDINKKISMATVKTARKLFANTPVQNWKITSWAYDKVFHYGEKNSVLFANYFDAKISIPARDITIASGLVGGFYEKKELEIYKRLSSASKFIVDVGANVGIYACIGGIAIAKNRGKIICFEPIAENLTFLTKNIKLNKLDEVVTIVPKAVGEKNGKIKVYLAKKNVGTHSVAQSVAGTGEYEEVEIVSLDEHFKNTKRIDILKIDVEGYDGFVLNGAKKILKRLSPSLFIELIPTNLIKNNYPPEKFINILTDNYKNIFLIDEKSGKGAPIKKQGLLSLAKKGRNTNIIAVNNRNHLKIIESII